MGIVRFNKKMEEAYWLILKEMYIRALPSADLDELMTTGEAQEDGFYNKYYLSIEDANEIYKKYTEGKKFKYWELNTLSFNVFLGGSPCSNKNTVVKVRKELNLKPI